MTLIVLNLDSARFECTFGRGCEGVCCRNGRPPVYQDEAHRIGANLDRILPLLRPEARAVVRRSGYLSRRRKAGQRTARVVGGWCVFFNRGCVLHQLGAVEGTPFLYKPGVCAMFPLAKDRRDRWYVRQKGYKGEAWDLACLDPVSSGMPAATSLRYETALVEGWETGSARADI
jgi:Protein of unknown function (DUF3109)